MRKRFYIFFVARDEAGQLRKISIPVQYLYILVAWLVIGALCLTGIASSYTRMLLKVAHYNQLRTEQAQLKDRYSRLEQVAKERDIQVASLGSLASEVLIYGLAAMGCNLLLGYTGLLSFGQGIFFGLGSYTVALTLTRWPLPMPLARLQARLLSAVMSHPPLTPATLELFAFDNTTELDAVDRTFGFRPRGLREHLRVHGVGG